MKLNHAQRSHLIAKFSADVNALIAKLNTKEKK